ncbi:MAG: CDP-alcohol phosphatidyltransferase family protein [Coprococcus sp.]
MKKMWIGCYNKSVILTYIGVAFAVIGMLYVTGTVPAESGDRFDVAMICLILSGICDLFDGFIARKCKRNNLEKRFGVQIDSLADVISFLVFPIVLLIQFHRESYGEQVLTYVFALLYVLCGVIRLAWFNSHVEETENRYYEGLPVTYMALILPVYYAIGKIFAFPGFCMGLFFLFPIVSVLFILNVKIKKPGGIWYLFFSVLAIGTSAVILCM